MAACPTDCSSPGPVTRPTPAPPSMSTCPSQKHSSSTLPSASRSTLAKINSPSVTSGSSPLYFLIPHSTKSAVLVIFSTSRQSRMPAGVVSRTCGISSPENSIRAAAFAAAAAQLPVVYPNRSPKRVLPISIMRSPPSVICSGSGRSARKQYPPESVSE